MLSTRTALVTAVIALLVVPLGCGGDEESGPIRPGDDVGGMVLTTGTPGERDIFEFCDPIVIEPGIYERQCAVPALPRVGLGHGFLAPSRRELAREWNAKSWKMTLDGRRIDLKAFGVLPDRRLVEPGAGGLVWLRQWNVVLTDPKPGSHTLRYVARYSGGTWDTTWTFTVRE